MGVEATLQVVGRCQAGKGATLLEVGMAPMGLVKAMEAGDHLAPAVEGSPFQLVSEAAWVHLGSRGKVAPLAQANQGMVAMVAEVPEDCWSLPW